MHIFMEPPFLSPRRACNCRARAIGYRDTGSSNRDPHRRSFRCPRGRSASGGSGSGGRNWPKMHGRWSKIARGVMLTASHICRSCRRASSPPGPRLSRRPVRRLRGDDWMTQDQGGASGLFEECAFVAVTTTDLARSKRFWVERLGLPMIREDETYLRATAGIEVHDYRYGRSGEAAPVVGLSDAPGRQRGDMDRSMPTDNLLRPVSEGPVRFSRGSAAARVS